MGWDNTAFLVDGRWVFRFPRRSIAVALLRTEASLLPAIAPRLPLTIPVPLHLGEPDGACPWPFAGYRRLSGETACRFDPDDDQRTRAARPLGRFLRALHAIPAAEAAALGAGPDTLGRVDVGKRRALTGERLREIHARGLISDPRPWLALADDVPTDFTPGGDTLVHGDLYARHLLLDRAGALTGVIDWGDAHLGDPAVDLAIAWAFLPPCARPAFLDAYGSVDADRWRVARLRALFSSAVMVTYGTGIDDAALVREGLWALDNLLRRDEPAA